MTLESEDPLWDFLASLGYEDLNEVLRQMPGVACPVGVHP